jgi:hypothetical protein
MIFGIYQGSVPALVGEGFPERFNPGNVSRRPKW